MFLQAPRKFGKSVGIGGKTIELNENNVGDFTAVDTALIPLLTRQGFVRVNDPNAPLSPGEGEKTENEVELSDEEKAKQSALALLQELDALSDVKLKEMLDLREIKVAADANHDTLVTVVHEVILEERRKNAEEAAKSAPPATPTGPTGGTAPAATPRRKKAQE